MRAGRLLLLLLAAAAAGADEACACTTRVRACREREGEVQRTPVDDFFERQLHVQYAAKWPLSVVLHPRAMRVYNKVLCLLLRVSAVPRVCRLRARAFAVGGGSRALARRSSASNQSWTRATTRCATALPSWTPRCATSRRARQRACGTPRARCTGCSRA